MDCCKRKNQETFYYHDKIFSALFEVEKLIEISTDTTNNRKQLRLQIEKKKLYFELLKHVTQKLEETDSSISALLIVDR